MAEQTEKTSGAAKAGIVGAIGLGALKFKGASLLGVKSLVSMVVSVGAYTMLFGWRYALVLVALIYIHEMGHYIYMKNQGLNPKAPVFIPLLGAYTAMTKLPDDKATHAWVAFAGPFVGGLAAYACYFLGLQSGNAFLIAAASTGFWLNLMQLIPVRPFDGGFIAECISPWLLWPGLFILGYLALTLHSFFLGIIAFLSLFALLKKRGPETSRPATLTERLTVTAAYLTLAVVLAYCHESASSHLSGLT